MLLLLDQNAPTGVRQLLPAHDVRTAFRMGWAELSNGELLAAAEAAGFDLLIQLRSETLASAKSHRPANSGPRLGNQPLGDHSDARR